MERRPWSVDPDLDLSPSRQIVEHVLDAIARRELGPGDQLPSVRALAAEALVNHNTVARAYLELGHLGVTEGQNGRGVFVTGHGPDIAIRARREATLETYRRAAAEALRAGHSKHDLQHVLGEESKTRWSA